MLGKLFFILQKLGFKVLVFLLTFSSGTGTRQGEGVKRTVVQVCQRLRGSTCHLDIVTGKIEHIGGWIGGPEHPVGIEEASLCRSTHRIGEYHLENIAFVDVMLCLFHHLAVGFFGIAEGQGAFHFQRPDHSLRAAL